MIIWYIKNLFFTIKYKLGIAKLGKDFSEGLDCCTCDDMIANCPEDCESCPFYISEGL